jgi:16S rRNA (guanine527-N7)-methyltransferase
MGNADSPEALPLAPQAPSPEAGSLEDLARAWAIPLDGAVRDRLLAYARLLLKWGERINLTGARSVAELLSEHFPDAFALAIRLVAAHPGGGEAIVDVGSGGGLPVLPLALLRTSSQFTLFEPIGKKVAFLRTAVRELGLGSRVKVVPAALRPQDATAGPVFDVALSRATFPPAEWLSLARRLVPPGQGGRIFALTSQPLQAWPVGLELLQATRYRPDRWLSELRRLI